MSRQVKKLNDDIRKLEEEGLLAPASPSASNGLYSSYNTDSGPSTRHPSVPASRDSIAAASTHGPGVGRGLTSRIGSVSASNVAVSTSERKRASPAPGSRASTPLAGNGRPTKRQRFSLVNMDDDSSAVSTPIGASTIKQVAASRPFGLSNINPNGSKGPVSASNNAMVSIMGEDEEVLYCTCQQVSFGNMVACDNPDCQYEWFHYDCVGLTEPPSGTWYCPTCTKERKESRDAGPDFKDNSNKRRK